MLTLLEHIRALWKSAEAAPAHPPIRLPIPPGRVVDPAQAPKPTARPEPLRAGSDYFQVRVSELFLHNEREWTTRFDPLVVVLSEFTYDGKHEGVPTIVGPALLKGKLPIDTPAGMIYENTRVAGLHPFRGGRINLAVILCRVVRKDYVRDFLGTIEGMAGALDPTQSLATYLKLGKTIVDGIEKVLGLDGDNQPLAGYRVEFDSNSGPILPGYHLLVNAPEGAFDAARFLVVGGKLHFQWDAPHGVHPFREADYVLYVLERAQPEGRSDVDQLPFYPMVQRARSEAANSANNAWANAKAILATVYQMAVASPDLTLDQALALWTKWADDLKIIRKGAIDTAAMSGTDGVPDVQRDEVTSILTMS